MKTSLLFTALIFLFHIQTNARSPKITLPFGTKEKIIKVRELPNTSAFQIKDGTYYDIGSLYSKKQFLWLGYSFGEPKYVGYLNSQEKYVPLTTEDLNLVAALAKIKLKPNPEISFFDKYISRPLLSILLCFICYASYSYYQGKKKNLDDIDEGELPSWPPNTVQ